MNEISMVILFGALVCLLFALALPQLRPWWWPASGEWAQPKGPTLREYRKSQGLTIKQAAGGLGMCPTSLGKKERGLSQITVEDAAVIMEWSGGQVQFTLEGLIAARGATHTITNE